MSAILSLLLLCGVTMAITAAAYEIGYRGGRAHERDDAEWKRTAAELGIDLTVPPGEAGNP